MSFVSDAGVACRLPRRRHGPRQVCRSRFNVRVSEQFRLLC